MVQGSCGYLKTVSVPCRVEEVPGAVHLAKIFGLACNWLLDKG